MKKVILASLCLLMTLGLSAQDNQTKRGDRQGKMDPAKIVERQSEHLAKELALDAATTTEFKKMYIEYNQELRKTRDSQDFPGKLDTSTLSDSQIDDMAEKFFDSMEDAIEVREEYYKKFRTILSPQQVIKMYQTERKMRNKVQGEMNKRQEARKKGARSN